MSPYLFILAVEPLAAAIRNCDKIHGLRMNTAEIRIGMYVDDTFLFLDGTENSLNESLSILNAFHECSGLKINLTKTQAIWLGQARTRPSFIDASPIKWVECFEFMGILFDPDPDVMMKKILREKFWKLRRS